MAKRYRPVERDQGFLLPPDMRDWLPADHPVWLLVTVVSQHLDTSAVHRHRKVGGAGRAAYDPDMLLTLLIWAWARGERSSRRIERLCQEDVSFRVICAGDAPDHVTLSRFRAALGAVTAELFAQVLRLCARLGMGRLDTIALDGVKIAANASATASRDVDGLRRLAERIVDEHATTDEAEDALCGPCRGDEVPAEAAHPRTRPERIRAALSELQAEEAAVEEARRQREERVAADPRVDADADGPTPTGRVPEQIEVAAAERELARAVTDQQAKIESYPQRAAEAEAAGRPTPLKPPTPVEQHYRVRKGRARLAKALQRQGRRAEQQQAGTGPAARKPKRNITDPDSRLLPVRGGGWVQGYNCQAVTSADGLIVATSVTNNPADVVQFEPMMRAAEAAATVISHARREPGTVNRDQADGGIGVLLADAGYFSEHNLTTEGPDRLIALGTARDTERAARTGPTHGPPPDEATPQQTMQHQLRTQKGIATYRKRSHIAETPFGHAKHNLRFRQFSQRGITAVSGEWTFHATVHNISKIFRQGHTLPAS
ncbi:Transposase [Haloechinothrix alba]|uniref:Transposase n=1 Tax=Haloechinothrix alba TaxID=664784 RepID=A0A238V3Y4_9PSEU|nr:transposase [Haloechinothrix alba]SNR28814.1 Transposase [Haloechinothrix alba]